jgi:hypothetical protein
MQSNILDFFFGKTHNSNIAMPGEFGHLFLTLNFYGIHCTRVGSCGWCVRAL